MSTRIFLPLVTTYKDVDISCSVIEIALEWFYLALGSILRGDSYD